MGSGLCEFEVPGWCKANLVLAYIGANDDHQTTQLLGPKIYIAPI